MTRKSGTGKIPGGTSVCKGVNRERGICRKRISGYEDIALETINNLKKREKKMKNLTQC